MNVIVRVERAIGFHIFSIADTEAATEQSGTFVDFPWLISQVPFHAIMHGDPRAVHFNEAIFAQKKNTTTTHHRVFIDVGQIQFAVVYTHCVPKRAIAASHTQLHTFMPAPF